MSNSIKHKRPSRSTAGAGAESLSGPPASSTPPSVVHAPFDVLPTEAILKIFLSACPRVNLPGERTLTSTPKPPDRDVIDPGLLATVCKRWRAIALAHHPLWATLAIQPLRIGKPSWDEWGSPKLRRYLTRSGSHPLDIRIGSGSRSNKAVISSILDSLSAHSKRWKSLSLHFPLEQTFLRQLDALEGQLLLLESVRFTASSKGAVGKGGKFLRSPSLKRITFDPCVIPKPVLSKINWRNTTEVVFDFSEFKNEQDFRTILECLATSTTALTFSEVSVGLGSSKNLTSEGKRKPVRLQKLRRLYLQYFDGNLDLFVCPSLEHLEITGGDEDKLVDFIKNSSCSLVSMHMRPGTINPGRTKQKQFYTIFSSASTLKSLSLDELADPILDILIFDSYQLLPSLETLYLNSVFKIEGGSTQYLASRIEGLKRILESRTQAAPPNQVEASTVGNTSRHDAGTSLKNCFFTFRIQVNAQQSANDGPSVETILETLRLFCISRKILTQPDIIFEDGSNTNDINSYALNSDGDVDDSDDSSD